jgi:hypothetical protein
MASCYDPETLNRLRSVYRRGIELLGIDDAFDPEAFASCVLGAPHKEDADLLLNEALQRYRANHPVVRVASSKVPTKESVRSLAQDDESFG